MKATSGWGRGFGHAAGVVGVGLMSAMGGECWAQAPVYSVQLVPDPPVPAGYPQPQRDPDFLLPDGRFVVSHLYNGMPGQQFIGDEDGWAFPMALPGYANARIGEVASNGDMIGSSWNGTGDNRPTLWRDGQVIDLSAFIGTSAYVSSVNAQGVIAGSKSDDGGQTRRAFTWRDGVTSELATPAGFDYAYATRTNSSGVSVGAVGTDSPRPVAWNQNTPTLLPVPDGDIWGAEVSDINDTGWMVGLLRYHDGPTGTYLWRNGIAEQISDHWMPWPPSLSESGDVLMNWGIEPSVWRDGVAYGMRDLQTPGFDGQVAWLHKMLDDGRMLGWVSVDGVMHNAIFTPIPSPGTVVLVLSGVLALAKRRRAVA